MRIGVLAAAVFLSAGPALADPPEVYACLADIGNGTTWGDCVNLIFAGCAGNDVGSEPHLACLIQTREDWRHEMTLAQTEVMGVLGASGAEELGGLMLAWPKFVEDKCNAVAEGRAHISAQAAQLGCQATEMVLMANEFRACVAGTSGENYCQRTVE